jgi:hypothetical protein
VAAQPDPAVIDTRGARWCAVALLALLQGCVRTQTREEVAAVFTPPMENNRSALQIALRQVFRRPVLLADDALAVEPTLIIAPTPARVGGQLIDGRRTASAAEQFSLVRTGNRCALIRQRTGQRLTLHGAHCHSVRN